MQPHCSYLICTIPQSGSMLLSEALKATGIAGRPEEYFEMLGRKSSVTHSVLAAKSGERQDSTKVWSVETYTQYLAKVIEEGTSRNGIFGAQVMWDYFDDFVCSLRLIPAYREIAVSDLLSTLFPNVHYIWVTRRDKVRHAIALWRAFQREIWMCEDTHSFRRGPSFHYEMIDRLVQQIMTKEEDWWRFFDACHIEPFTVVFDELLDGIESTIRGVLRYLQIPMTNDSLCADWRVPRQAQQSRLLA